MKLGSFSTGGGQLELDLDKLLESRLLIQANSGGGKSWAIRKLLEETHGKVQQIVLDIEGDFASLREKYDFILAGKGGDIEANPKIAEILAHKVLELGVSIVIDLYELKQPERIKFVARFLDAMTNAPKTLWHPVLVVIDEAHIFAPENGKAESSSAVIDIATRGRKRGYCAVLATQRLSKLNKDVAAECINKMIGRTGLDIDMKRAGDELGFDKAHTLALRDLPPGYFYVFGPALTRIVKQVQIGDVKTKHPKAGKRMGSYTPAPPTSKVKSLLAKLSDLPQEAEKDLHDKAAMMVRIKHLEAELRKKPAPIAVAPKIDMVAVNNTIVEARNLTAKAIHNFFETEFALLVKKSRYAMDKMPASKVDSSKLTVAIPMEVSKQVVISNKYARPVTDAPTLGKCETLILRFLFSRAGHSFTKAQLGAMTHYAYKSGSFSNSLSKLRSLDFIAGNADQIRIVESNLKEIAAFIGDDPDLTSYDALQLWLNRLGKCERVIYEKILEDPSRTFSKEELGNSTGYAAGSGSFSNSISKLCTLGLAARTNGGIHLNPELRAL